MPIIQEQTIHLNDQFKIVKNRIQTINKFRNLHKICSFDNQQRALTFRTEKIHPQYFSKSTKPVMLLFSNPHPISVQNGMFLSEPRSRAFWERLFSCKYFKSHNNLVNSVMEWSDTTIKKLTNHLLNPDYSDKITLFFDCLESLPSNQYNDLRTILPNRDRKNLRKNILQTPGKESLCKISLQHNINSWVVFSVEAFRNILGEKNIGKSAPDRICETIDKYLLTHDNIAFWKQIEDLRRVITIEGKEIFVYLSLIARRKNQLSHTGEYYFTIMLDQIFNDIYRRN